MLPESAGGFRGARHFALSYFLRRLSMGQTEPTVFVTIR